MTLKKARALGYEVVAASPFEVGLTKNGRGLRTWWCSDFGRKLPPLDHPLIQKAIKAQEEMDRFFAKATARQVAKKLASELKKKP